MTDKFMATIELTLERGAPDGVQHYGTQGACARRESVLRNSPLRHSCFSPRPITPISTKQKAKVTW